MRQTDVTAPYVILLPGFATQYWNFSDKDVKLGYVMFMHLPVFPELTGDLIWVRISCGHT